MNIMTEIEYYKNSIKMFQKQLISNCMKLKKIKIKCNGLTEKYLTIDTAVFILLQYACCCKNILNKKTSDNGELFFDLDMKDDDKALIEKQKCDKCNSESVYIEYDEVEDKFRFYCKNCDTWMDNLEGFDLKFDCEVNK